MKCGNDAVTASDLCEALASMSSLPGDHKNFVLEPTAAELEQDIPLKGGKGSNAKHFSLYHEIEFKYHERTGAFLGLNVREQFQFGPSQWFPMETLN